MRDNIVYYRYSKERKTNKATSTVWGVQLITCFILYYDLLRLYTARTPRKGTYYVYEWCVVLVLT